MEKEQKKKKKGLKSKQKTTPETIECTMGSILWLEDLNHTTRPLAHQHPHLSHYDLKGAQNKKGLPLHYPKMVVEVNNNFHEHINRLMLKMASSLFCVFYVSRFCIQGRRWRWAFSFSWFRLWACKLTYVVVLFFMKLLVKGILISA